MVSMERVGGGCHILKQNGHILEIKYYGTCPPSSTICVLVFQIPRPTSFWIEDKSHLNDDITFALETLNAAF